MFSPPLQHAPDNLAPYVPGGWLLAEFSRCCRFSVPAPDFQNHGVPSCPIPLISNSIKHDTNTPIWALHQGFYSEGVVFSGSWMFFWINIGCLLKDRAHLEPISASRWMPWSESWSIWPRALHPEPVHIRRAFDVKGMESGMGEIWV